MPVGRFTAYTVAGCLPWTFALAGAGYALGTQWAKVDRYFKPVSLLLAAILVGLVAWWIVKRVRERRREPERQAAAR
jgi:membrane protein DedA with SNARE-associated domain